MSKLTRLAENVYMVTASQDVDGSKCEGCDICCFIDPVVFPEYTKKSFSQCKHQTPECRCGDYENRPIGCRHYGCEWLRGGVGDKYKPTVIKGCIEKAVITSPMFEGEITLYTIGVVDIPYLEKVINFDDFIEDFKDGVVMLYSQHVMQLYGVMSILDNYFKFIGCEVQVAPGIQDDQYVGVELPRNFPVGNVDG